MTTHEPSHSPEQLALLSVDATPVQFRLDQRTRERGLAHVAAIKALLAARAAARQETHAQPQAQPVRQPARRQAA
jgi:hypothetical protein